MVSRQGPVRGDAPSYYIEVDTRRSCNCVRRGARSTARSSCAGPTQEREAPVSLFYRTGTTPWQVIAKGVKEHGVHQRGLLRRRRQFFFKIEVTDQPIIMSQRVTAAVVIDTTGRGHGIGWGPENTSTKRKSEVRESDSFVLRSSLFALCISLPHLHSYSTTTKHRFKIPAFRHVHQNGWSPRSVIFRICRLGDLPG